MPCDTMVKTAAERRAREEALEELAQDLEAGRKKVMRNALTGEVSISGWAGSTAKTVGWCEGCAMVALTKKNPRLTGLKWGQSFTAASHNGHKHTVKAGHGGCGGHSH